MSAMWKNKVDLVQREFLTRPLNLVEPIQGLACPVGIAALILPPGEAGGLELVSHRKKNQEVK